MLRPVFVLLAGGFAAGCSGVDQDARFEQMAQNIADIPVTQGGSPAAESGLRPAFPQSNGSKKAPALTVQVMDPHDLWDARDGLRQAHPVPVPLQVPPVHVNAGQAAAVLSRTAEATGLRPAFAAHERTAPAVAMPRTVQAEVGPRATIQLGAYSSTEAARMAWANARSGKAGPALRGLSPEFVTIQRGGKTLVRLRVSAPATTAAALCQAAQVSDPWCLRGT